MICKTAKKYIQRELDGELDREQWTDLQHHLFKCDTCRQFQQHMFAIQSAIHELIDVSQLSVSKAPTVDFGRPRTIPWRTGLAAAAIIALFFAGWLTFNIPQTDSPSQPVIAKAQKVDHPLAAAISKLPDNVRVTFDDDVISVPIKSENPNVTIIWIYQTVKTANKSNNSNGPPPDSTRKETNHEKVSKC